MSQTSTLVDSVEDVLMQGQALLRSIPAELFARRVEGPFGASIGEHYRHVLDHFLCLLRAQNMASVNYDKRDRDPRLEVDVDHALRATEALIEAFRAISEDEFQRFYTVVYSVGYGGNTPDTVSSTLGRELAFSVGHAIHHYAIVRLLCAHLGVTVPAEFGIAPSTLKHRRARAAYA